MGETRRELDLTGVPEPTIVEVLIVGAQANRRDVVEQCIAEIKRRSSATEGRPFVERGNGKLVSA